MLSSYRVLDLSDERGQLAGLMLSDLGADVILVEPPTGSRSRQVGPFVEGHQDDPEASLWFWSYNRGKRSCALDLQDPSDKEKFLRLAESADVIIESSGRTAMRELGLSYEDVTDRLPHIVYTSVSAFGNTGPKADWAATDLVVSAAGMLSNIMGDSDRRPLRIPLDQTFLHASGEAAYATLIALRERKRSGLGQHVDVSAQQTITLATQAMALCHLYNSPEATRTSGGVALGPFLVRLRARCADGFVSPSIVFGEAIGPFSRRLFERMYSEGACTEADVETDWIDFVDGVMTGRIPLDEYERIQQVAADYFATLTKREILDASLKHRLLVVPISTVADVAEEPHYQEREFWHNIDMSSFGAAGGFEVGDVPFPGPAAKLSKTPMQFGKQPPRRGEHTAEVLALVGTDVRSSTAAPATASTATPATAAAASSAPAVGTAPTATSTAASAVSTALSAAAPAASAGPLAGLKVLDFMWVIAGPACTRVLSDWGATVVRVESSHKVETARTLQPFLNDEGGPDNGGIYQTMNAGKLGITIDLDNPASRELIEDLVRWADVVAESFSPKVMRGWNLAYEDIRKIKPEIIMASSCLFGQSGPLSQLAGFGSMGAAMSGFYEMTGWPDRDPCGVFSAYTDFVSPKFLGSAILAALEHRDKTGEGQHIDLSQVEASFTFLAPALLDYAINGHLPEKVGNDHPTMSPHDMFRCAGEDCWLAIACENDAQWRSLCEVAGLEKNLTELDATQRRNLSTEISAAITNWTQPLAAEEAQQMLQDAGVPAHVVHTSETLSQDPQLVQRRHFRQVPHITNETMWVEGPRFAMSRSTDVLNRAGPSYGEHTFLVLEELLGYDADRVAELAVASVLE